MKVRLLFTKEQLKKIISMPRHPPLHSSLSEEENRMRGLGEQPYYLFGNHTSLFHTPQAPQVQPPYELNRSEVAWGHDLYNVCYHPEEDGGSGI